MAELSVVRAPTTVFWWVARAPLAIVGGFVLGQIAQIILALLIDFVWQANVTAGRWPFTLPNILLACLAGYSTGFGAGWFAGRHGKVIGAAVITLPLLLTIVFFVVVNVDPTAYFESKFESAPAVWTWVGLVPGVIGGHFGAVCRRRYPGQTALLCSVSVLYATYLGSFLLHFYTVLVAFKAAGPFAALVSFFTPFFAEIYWSWRIWRDGGTEMFLVIPGFVVLAVIRIATLKAAGFLAKD